MKVAKILLVAGLAMAGMAANAGIASSKHDFTTRTDGAKTTQICIVCHVPHNAMSATAAPGGVLWNHNVDTNAVYTPYAQTPSLDATAGGPGNVSKLCLSCHDGTIGINSFGGVTATTEIKLTGAANVGKDLSNDHPIGFVYDDTLAGKDGALFAPSTTQVLIGSSTSKTKDGKLVATLLGNVGTGATGGTMECSSCHDVHNTFTADSGSKLVKVTMAGSGLCLKCHDK